jgi:hypothetical protein
MLEARFSLESLPGKHKALSSNPHTTKEREKRNRKEVVCLVHNDNRGESKK